MTQQFIFQPGIWLGEGTMSFSSSPEKVRFFVKWNIMQRESGTITCQQQIEIQGLGESIFNNFRFFEIELTSFIVELENEISGRVRGTGILSEKKIAWEFRGHDLFEGFDVYDLQENGDYLFHSEYVSTDQHRTTVEGRLWKKS